MRKYISVFIILMININIHAHKKLVSNNIVPCILLTQGHVLESISGEGFPNSTSNRISNISSSNPAAINDFKDISLGISYQSETSINPTWISDFIHKRDKKYLPQSVGLVIPYKKFVIGFGFSQRYNSILDFGRIDITTIENPEGTGEYFTPTISDMVISYSGLLSYVFENAINNNDRLSFGIQCNYNKLNDKENFGSLSVKIGTDNFGWTGGILYQVIDRFQFGVFYERNPLFREKIRLGDDFLTPVQFESSIPGNNQNLDLTPDVYLESKLPDKFHAGFQFNLNSISRIKFDITNIYWNQVSENNKNNVDISLGFVHDIARQLSFSVGFLSTDRHYKEMDYFFDISDKLYSIFLLGGLNLKFKYFDLDFAYVTTTNNSGDWRKQKFGKASIGFYL